jgi:hypothetical protein
MFEYFDLNLPRKLNTPNFDEEFAGIFTKKNKKINIIQT